MEKGVGATIGRPAILEQNCIVKGDILLFSSKKLPYRSCRYSSKQMPRSQISFAISGESI